MEKTKPERRQISMRMRKVLWLAIGVAPVFVYIAIAYVLSSRGYEGQTPYSDSIIGVFVALGIIVFLFNLGLVRRGLPERDDRAFIICLALAEAIGIEGFALFFLIGWNWGFWAMLLMALLSGWSLRPRETAV